ncbi:GNAT superfamily N-acetyltransferase [Thermostichus sp. MS-CIW-23]|jgi:Acetyltransferases|uniref:GNAT family N-acetyltransferase n=1 Tax=Synechococcus sp. R6-7 TaxID=2291958 RepID=UPI0039C25FE7
MLAVALSQPVLPSPVVYPATSNDLDPLAEVLAQVFHPPSGLQRWIYPIRKLGIREELRLRLAARDPHYCCLAAAVGSEVVGTAEISLRVTAHGKYPYLSNLAVLPGWRRRGIARLLLLSAEGVAKGWGYRCLHLHVLEDNLPARQLYAQLRYTPIERTSQLWRWLGIPPQLLLCKWLP